MKVIMAERTDIYHDTRILKEARSLANAGYDVTVYGFRRKWKTEEPNKYNFNITTFPVVKREYRLLRNISIFINIFIIHIIIMLTKADYYHAHNTMFLVGMYLSSKIHTGKFIYDNHEVQWENTRADSLLEKLFINKVDAIICVSDGIANEVAKRYSIPKDKFTIVSNYPNIYDSEIDLDQKLDLNNIKFVFSGGASIENIENFLFAIKDMNGILLYLQIYGRGNSYEKIKQLIFNLKIDNKVKFLPLVEPERINEVISKYDVAFNLPTNPKNKMAYRYSSSNKMYQYLSAGLPILCSNLEIYEKDFVDNGIAISVEARDIKSIANGIQRFINNPHIIKPMSKKAIDLSKTIFNWGTQEIKLINMYKMMEMG